MDYNIITNLDVPKIKAYQQNRYPVLLLDMITEVLPGQYAKGYKSFTYNEWFFPGHFEDEPNVPGFIQMEVLSQTFIMTFLTLPEHKSKKTAFIKADNVTFKRKIVPGECMETHAVLKSFKHGIARGSVTSMVKGEEACCANFIIGLPDIIKASLPEGK